MQTGAQPQAELVHEPNNPYDPNAIAVYAATEIVGYLPRDLAADYATVFRELHQRGYNAGSCQAKLTGGTDDKPSLGVVLRLSSPQTCLEALEAVGGATD